MTVHRMLFRRNALRAHYWTDSGCVLNLLPYLSVATRLTDPWRRPVWGGQYWVQWVRLSRVFEAVHVDVGKE